MQVIQVGLRDKDTKVIGYLIGPLSHRQDDDGWSNNKK